MCAARDEGVEGSPTKVRRTSSASGQKAELNANQEPVRTPDVLLYGAGDDIRTGDPHLARLFSNLARLPLPCLPDLFGRPPTSPVQRHERKIGRRVFGRSRLNEILDRETICAQESDPLSVTDVEFDLLRIRPFKSVHSKVGTQELVARGPLLLALGDAKSKKRRIAHND